MLDRGLTRRSLLAAGAGALAGELVRPRGALAALRDVSRGSALRPALFERPVGQLAANRRASVELGRNADLVGVRWSGAPSASVELRFRDEHGGWSPWTSAAHHGHGPAGAPTAGDPVWSGGSTLVQVRSNRAISHVRLSCVDVSGGLGARTLALASRSLAIASSPALASPDLPAGPGQPPVIARRVWARGVSKPRLAPEYGTVQLGFVHHTDNPNGYLSGEVPAMLRAIFTFHRYVNGWNDIGYNFVIDRFGRTFEARAGGIDEPVVGAHAGGYNYVSTGVAVLGEFTGQAPSPAAALALERLLAWKLSLHGIPSEGRVTVKVDPAGAVYSRYPAGAPVSLPRVAGHRDGDQTDCPGNVLYGELPSLRPRIARLAGRPARATLAPGVPAAPPGQPQPLTGTLAFLDGTPISGAPIAIQARTVTRRGEVVAESTVAQAVSGPQGEWSLALPLVPQAGGTSLRALCPGAGGVPATVSDPLQLPASPAG